MVIREVIFDDAGKLIKLVKKVEAESPFMMMEAGERQTTPEQQRTMIESLLASGHSTIFVAESTEGELVGYLYAIGNGARKKRHCAYLVIGILAEYRGRGIGTRLFAQLDEWAARNGIERLELTVVTDNEAAVALYEKCGFNIEGKKLNSLKQEEKYIHEYLMAKMVE